MDLARLLSSSLPLGERRGEGLTSEEVLDENH
jgi:hypothetical protein